jgi:hypothetical protein
MGLCGSSVARPIAMVRRLTGRLSRGGIQRILPTKLAENPGAKGKIARVSREGIWTMTFLFSRP